ncbi:iron uptake cluster protein [Amylocystis lapponica]|nr:iron uptake cluster protein [Amylocystis lapponica]
MSPATLTKTVAVLGASFGGAGAAQVLARGLPKGWRVVVVDRNTHLNHLYVLPRYAVLPGHEHKAFIPYTTMFRGSDMSATSVVLHAQVTSLSPHSVTLSRAFPEHGVDSATRRLPFDYLIYALGSHMPAPVDLWGPVADESVVIPPSQGTKAEGMQWLKRFQKRVERSPSVLVVGSGALGIQYATDIAEVYPTTHVTLLHSRERLLPKFEQQMHDEIVSRLSALNVTTILGDRLDLSSVSSGKTLRSSNGTLERVVRTQSGREVSAELILLCTGQTPNTALMEALLPKAVVPDGPNKGCVRVQRSMQVAVPAPTSSPGQGGWDDTGMRLHVPYPHLFAIGDAADAFGAMNAGHTAHSQGDIAARNILTLIKRASGASDAGAELEHYVAPPDGIKVTLGLRHGVSKIRGPVQAHADGVPDLNAKYMWKVFGIDVEDADMYK